MTESKTNVAKLTTVHITRKHYIKVSNSNINYISNVLVRWSEFYGNKHSTQQKKNPFLTMTIRIVTNTKIK